MEQSKLTKLRQILAGRFSAQELRTLCFDLSVEYDDLPARGRADKARELVAHCERHNCIPTLVKVGRRQRPDIEWAVVSEPPPGSISHSDVLESPSSDNSISVTRLVKYIFVGMIAVILIVLGLDSVTGDDALSTATNTPTPTQTPMPTSTLMPRAQTMKIAILGKGLEERVFTLTKSSMLDWVYVKGDTLVTIKVQVSDQYENVIAPDMLACRWELCCDDGDKILTYTQTCDWSFQPPTDRLTKTLTIGISDRMNHHITATIPFTITVR